MLAEILQIRMLHIGGLIRQSLDVQQTIRPSLKIPIRESTLHMLELALEFTRKNDSTRSYLVLELVLGMSMSLTMCFTAELFGFK